MGKYIKGVFDDSNRVVVNPAKDAARTGPCILRSEEGLAIRQVENNKAPVPDEIPMELFGSGMCGYLDIILQ